MLQRLGRVLHKTHNGYIVVSLEVEDKRLPPLNTPVYDPQAHRVGTLLDIIGPVERPYAVVKPDRKEIEVSEGAYLYYRPPRPRPRARARRRGRSGAPARRGRRR